MTFVLGDGHDLDGRYLFRRAYVVTCWIKNPTDGEQVTVEADGLCPECGIVIETIRKGTI